MSNHAPQTFSEDVNGKLHDLLAGLWTRSRASIDERTRILQTSLRALRVNPADAAARRAGADNAHKLAGILGTFGLPDGTSIARRIEVALDSGAPLLPLDLDAMERTIQQLEQMIEDKSRDAGKRRA